MYIVPVAVRLQEAVLKCKFAVVWLFISLFGFKGFLFFFSPFRASASPRTVGSKWLGIQRAWPLS